MTTTTKSRPPLQRTCAIHHREGDMFLLEITVQKSRNKFQTDFYIAWQITAGFGVGYRLEKPDTEDLANETPVEVYHVNLHGLDGHHFCDCRGFERSKSGGCKHVLALQALVARGQLVPKPTEADMERVADEAENLDAE